MRKRQTEWAEAKDAAERMRQVMATTPEGVTEQMEISFSAVLEKLGYEFDHEYGDTEERTEVWVNRKISMGISIEWFHLVEV